MTMKNKIKSTINDLDTRLFPILLNSKSFQTTLDCSRPMTSCHVTSQSHALSLLS